MDKKAKALTEQAAVGPAGTGVQGAEGPAAGPAEEAVAATPATENDVPRRESDVPVEEDEGTAEAEQPAAAPDEVDPRVAALEAEKEALDHRLAELRDRLLRSAADFDNFRKRVARQEQETLERSQAEALRMFLPVIDNVERALAFAEQMAGGEQVAQGLQLVLRGFFETFTPQGLSRVEALGKPFDPTTHEAVGQLETAETPAGCVVQQLQAGYLLKQRLLRPALVVVAKPPPAATAGTPPPEAAEEPGPSQDGPEGA